MWALAVAWVLYACATRHARLLNDWLSWGPLKVVGRLSYSMLLVHPLVIVSQKAQNRHITFFSHFDMMHLFFGHYAVSLLLSFFVYLTVEEPFAQLGEIFSSCELCCPPRLKQLTQDVYAGITSRLPAKKDGPVKAKADERDPENGVVVDVRQEVVTTTTSTEDHDRDDKDRHSDAQEARV
ncbi:unnamed protein product [Ixodes hexagonus]